MFCMQCGGKLAQEQLASEPAPGCVSPTRFGVAHSVHAGPCGRSQFFFYYASGYHTNLQGRHCVQARLYLQGDDCSNPFLDELSFRRSLTEMARALVRAA